MSIPFRVAADAGATGTRPSTIISGRYRRPWRGVPELADQRLGFVAHDRGYLHPLWGVQISAIIDRARRVASAVTPVPGERTWAVPRRSVDRNPRNRGVSLHDDSRGSAELPDGAFGSVGELDAELVELGADLVGAGPVALLAGLGPVLDEFLDSALLLVGQV